MEVISKGKGRISSADKERSVLGTLGLQMLEALTTPTVNTDDTVDLIALLKEYASRDDWVLEGTGADFANGYTTSGGLPVEVCERFKETCLEIVMKEMLVERRRSREAEEIGQRNTLDTYLIKEPSSMGMQLAHKFVKFNQNHV